MRTPEVDDALEVVRLAARRAVEAGASPAAVTWEATATALDAEAGRDPLRAASPDARRLAKRAAEAVGW
jgi:hypothetical protein